ncbi:lysophospholipid acyltransferase family protein [Microbacterium sp. SORGH_AS_0888]|uniref:lysophospholipid acyltransferase family protein n=1 Tax=Microbacterium sp. SORGH_AS_0888 TaxID=3041791 RepID=UPI00277F5DC7|nr:lysophospholipid acyltransferase family protein [Microbacterium sp. SORGH_AS_0888]MDQ1131043.1 1-acyl-sn-glycerol-3-phosphate acyltransferase [Microbacterium sp. SORGH_AS_0888]
MNLGAFVRAVSAPYVRYLVRKHVASISGLDNLPPTGSFILVPNHTSYFDHFAVEIILEALRGTPTWFLTKRESFARPLPRAWARAWYGIPVDRDAPTPDTLREVRRVLMSGDALCVYPEGTRGDGTSLLPFKSGAFRFAIANDVVVIPLGLAGTETVLARGDRWFRGRGRLDMAFGPALRAPAQGSAQMKAAALSADARVAINELKSKASQQRRAAGDLARNTVRELDRLITNALSEGGALRGEDLRQLRRIARYLGATIPKTPAFETQLLRLDGLAAGQGSKALFPLKALTIRVRAERILRQSPNESVAHYILGRWHLSVPRALGSKVERSIFHFEAATASANRGDTRALSGLADAYLAANDPTSAVASLRRVLAETDQAAPRAEYRRVRTMERIASLTNQMSKTEDER